MALIHVYSGLNEKETYRFDGKLCDHIKGVDWENSICLKGGYKITPDYEVQKDDVIYVRKLPTAGVSTSTLVIIALAVTAVAAGVTAGVALYQSAEAQKKLEENEKAAKAASEKANALPFIKGARNQAATGQTFPYVIGESLFTPYRLCPPHIVIEGEKGEKQYYYITLEAGYNNLLIKQLRMGETLIKDFSSDTTPQNGVYDWDNGVYYDSANKIEIRQSGDFEDDNFNRKIIYTDITTEIPHEHAGDDATENAKIEEDWKNGVVQELPSYAMACDVVVLFDGLRKYEDNGWKECSITLKPQWTNAKNPEESDWEDFDEGFNQNGTISNTFEYMTKEQMRYVAHQDFKAVKAYGKNIKVRIIRTTPKTKDGNAKDSVYFLGVNTTCYDNKKSNSATLVPARVLEESESAKCCRIGIKVIANANTTGNLDAFTVIESGVANTWNGKEWSKEKTPTRNLAAWVREIMLSDKHAPSRYSAEELDGQTFGEWYEYCEKEGFHADGVISKATKKKTLIETLLTNGNAELVFNPFSGKIEVAVDNGRDYSVAMLNSENIISISTTKEFKRKTDGIRIKYVNRQADFVSDSVTFMRDGGEYDPSSDTLSSAGVEYITDYEHAYKYAWRRMAEELAQPRKVIVKVGLEAAYYPLFSRVELQHKSLKIGIAHATVKGLQWEKNLLKKIVLSGYVDFPTDKACGVIINCVNKAGHGIVALKVNGNGRTDELEVETALRDTADVIPSVGNALSFGELDNNGKFTTVTKTMKIVNAEETENGFSLTLVDYNDGLYNYGKLPEYKSNITTIPNDRKAYVPNYVTPDEVTANASEAAQAAVDTISGLNFSNVYTLRNNIATIEDIIRKMDEDAEKAAAGISITEEAIVLKVEDEAANQRSLVALTKDEILAQVDDMAANLTGLIDVQAGMVAAFVEGGGASGQMSLSVNLPIVISASTRNKLVSKSTEAKVAAVYALIANTESYGIKGNASNTAVKELWNDAVKGGLLASQINLNADQISIDGSTIFSDSKATNVADVFSSAKSYADSKASTAESSAKKNAFDKMAENLKAMGLTVDSSTTVISGGKIKTSLIDADALMAQLVTIKDGGALQNDGFSSGNKGFKISSDGTAEFNNATIRGTVEAQNGSFYNINIVNSVFEGAIDSGPLYLDSASPTAFTKTFPKDTDITTIVNAFTSHFKTSTGTYTFEESSKYGNTSVSKITIESFIKNNELFYRLYISSGDTKLITLNQYTGTRALENVLYITQNSSTTKTLKLRNLPTSKPTETGIVWNDNGILKIVT